MQGHRRGREADDFPRRLGLGHSGFDSRRRHGGESGQVACVEAGAAREVGARPGPNRCGGRVEPFHLFDGGDVPAAEARQAGVEDAAAAERLLGRVGAQDERLPRARRQRRGKKELTECPLAGPNPVRVQK